MNKITPNRPSTPQRPKLYDKKMLLSKRGYCYLDIDKSLPLTINYEFKENTLKVFEGEKKQHPHNNKEPFVLSHLELESHIAARAARKERDGDDFDEEKEPLDSLYLQVESKLFDKGISFKCIDKTMGAKAYTLKIWKEF